MKHPLSIIAISLILIIGNTRPSLGQTPQTAPPLGPQAEEIRKQIEKIGFGNQLTVILPAGQEYYGTITKVDSTEFTIAEVDLKQALTLKYDEVKKVRKGYGRKHSLTGMRINPRTSLIAGMAVVGCIIGLAFFAASQTK
jgi:hypothetical protein